MRPTIICHMAITVDGKINGDALASVADLSDYEATAELKSVEQRDNDVLWLRYDVVRL